MNAAGSNCVSLSTCTRACRFIMTRAAGIPFPATSASTQPVAPVGQCEEVVVVATHAPARGVVAGEVEPRYERVPPPEGSAAECRRPGAVPRRAAAALRPPFAGVRARAAGPRCSPGPSAGSDRRLSTVRYTVGPVEIQEPDHLLVGLQRHRHERPHLLHDDAVRAHEAQGRAPCPAPAATSSRAGRRPARSALMRNPRLAWHESPAGRPRC